MKTAKALVVLLAGCFPLCVGATILEVQLLQTVEGSFSDITVDDAGRFYLLDSQRGTVLVLRPEQGVPLVEFDLLDTGGRVMRGAASICMVADGGMAVLDRGKRKIVLYGSDGLPRGEFPIGDAKPQCMAQDPFERLLVLDEEGRILLFGSDGVFLGVLGAGAGDGMFFTTPRSLACDSQGNVFVLEGEGGQFRALNPLGQAKATPLTREEGLLFLRDPRDVFVDASGFLYVADAEVDRCLVFSMEGFIGTFGSEGVGEGRFREPICVASDGKGNVAIGDAKNGVVQFFNVRGLPEHGGHLTNWLLPPVAKVSTRTTAGWQSAAWRDGQWAGVVDGRLIVAERPGGVPQAEATGEDFRRLSALARVAWDGTGSVWVVDPERRGVWVWSPPTGRPRLVPVPEKSFRPIDVALSPWGEIAVADNREGRVALFDPAGAWSRWLVPSGTGKPVALAFAPDSTLWVGLRGGTVLGRGRGGGIKREVALGNRLLKRLADIDVDAGGNVLMLGTTSLLVVGTDDQVMLVVGSDKRGALQWRDAASVASGPADTLWVLEPKQDQAVGLGFTNLTTGAIAGLISPSRRATVWAVADGNRVGSADIVPPSATFTIAGLPPGTYSADVEGPGLIPLEGVGSASVVPGRIWDLGLWELTPAATLHGRLVPADDKVEVMLRGEESFSAVTGEQGEFVFGSLPAGSYRIEVQREGYLAFRGEEFSVGVGESLWVGEVEMTSTGTIELDVRAPGAETVWANVWSEGQGWTTHQGSGDDVLAVRDLSPGMYRIVITAEGFRPDSGLGQIRLGPGERKVLSQLELVALPNSSGQWARTVDQGVRAYERADFPSAVSHLEQAVAAEKLSFGDQTRALLYLGLAAVALGEEEKATRTFRELCLIWPGCSLPPEYSSARLENLLEQARPFQ
jgi:hypothetical protein